jgi:glycerophosphoryl diester phosphodiesterase
VLVTPAGWAVEPSGVANAAHRGASAAAPENTLAAVVQAVADRADYVELDVRQTRDRVLVALHDRDLARTTDAESVFPGRSPWRVEDFTLAELRRLDAGSWKDPSYAGERVPTLAAVLRELSGSASGAFVEVKEPGRYGGAAVVGRRVYDTIAAQWASPGRHEVRVQSFNAAFVRAFARSYPGVRVGTIGLANPSAVAAYADDMQVHHANVIPALVDDAHRNGLLLGAWTVDQPATMRAIAGLGVDNITTNRPRRLRTILAAEGLTYTGTQWPPPVAQTPTWSLSTSGRFLNTPVRVTATLSTNGSPARWQRAAVQLRRSGGWRTLQSRATDSTGRFAATIPGLRGLRLRVISLDDWQYPLASSAPHDVALTKMASMLRLSGPDSIRAGNAARLTIRWRSADGRAITGRAAVFQRRVGGTWRHLRDVNVANGHRRIRVHPPHTTRYKVRGRTGWWYQADTARMLVVVG